MSQTQTIILVVYMLVFHIPAAIVLCADFMKSAAVSKLGHPKLRFCAVALIAIFTPLIIAGFVTRKILDS